MNDLEKAKITCKKISYMADKIKNNINLIDPNLEFLNPQNWKNDNDAVQTIKDALRMTPDKPMLDLSSEEIIDIKNSCKNTFGENLSYYEDISKCPQYEESNKYKNYSDNVKSCIIGKIINNLRIKKANVKSFAIAKALQDIQDKKFGTSKCELCNFIDKKMDKNKYIEMLKLCSTISNTIEENDIPECGNMLDNIQKKSSDLYQQCMVEKTTTIKNMDDLKFLNELQNNKNIVLNSKNNFVKENKYYIITLIFLLFFIIVLIILMIFFIFY